MRQAILRSPLGAGLDMVLDPVTRDYVDTEDGAWLESADSRTLVMIALEIEYGASPFDWTDGTRVKAQLRNADGDPLTPEFVVGETLRALRVLETEGIIADLEATMTDAKGEMLVDDAGRPTCALWWRDMASGSPMDLYYTPEG